MLPSPTEVLNIFRRAPGNVVDWMYAKAGIKYSYAVHLRDTGTVRPTYRTQRLDD